LANLKKSEDRDHAISLVNTYLSKDPSNEEALLHIADINYRRGEIDQAEKAVDFLNTTKEEKDPLGLYIK
jgi:DNA-binding SARP family transcriptional activator